MRKGRTCVGGAAVTLALLAGCGNPAPEASDLSDSTAFFELAIDEARTQGASAAQLAVLERAKVNGSLSYADASGLLPSLQGCIEDAGGVFSQGEDIAIGPDLRAPTYVAGVPGLSEDAALALVEDCERVNVDAVLGALWNQPSTVEARNAEFAAQLSEIVTCLANHGVTIDANAPLGEVQALVQDLAAEQGVTCYEQSWA